MAGELIGMDGTPGKHFCDAIALQDSSVCQIAYSEVEQLRSEIPNLRQYLNRLIKHATVRDYGSMLMLDKMHSRERLAFFLLNLSTRYAAHGYSPTRIKLEMPRKDIENYLGLTPETLDATLEDLEQDRIIELENKSVQIKNLARLKKISKEYITRRRTK
jgi:CRP/FNR family transcriptional regulator